MFTMGTAWGPKAHYIYILESALTEYYWGLQGKQHRGGMLGNGDQIRFTGKTGQWKYAEITEVSFVSTAHCDTDPNINQLPDTK